MNASKPFSSALPPAPAGTDSGSSSRYRVGIDIGGTFTDFVMLDTRTGTLFNEKLLTTPDDPSRAVLKGLELLMQQQRVLPGQIEQVIHGTTLVANALIERKGVRTALVTTRGFSDVLELGLEWRYDTYDLKLELPPPLSPRGLRFEVDERIGPDGLVIVALDPASVRRSAQQIHNAGAQAVGICLLHSFRNPVHEQQVEAILREELPGLVMCTSSDVVPEIGEYERMSTTVANAYVLPLFDRYLGGITAGLREIGIHHPLYLVLSDGGTVHESTAIRHPIRLVQSGPAGGVQATTLIGASAGCTNLLCFDMGGTTAKACLIDHGEPLRTNEFEVARVYRFKKGSGLPLRIPVIDMIEIGAGGGSIARIDRLGLLQVGPDSSSAMPGPACYGQGGLDATVTDADLVLGYLGPDSFLGGDMWLDVQAARDALERSIARPLGLSIEEAAWGIHDLVNENMARAAAIHALEKARRIADYAMVPIGGAGPVHACHISEKLALSQIICAPGAGVASAFGFLAAPTSFTFSRGRVEPLESLDFASVNQLLSDMQSEGEHLLEQAGTARSDIEIAVFAAMRYQGQGYEVDLEVSRHLVLSEDREKVGEAFSRAYRQLFGRDEAAMAIEVVSWRLIARGPRPTIRSSSGQNPSVSSASPNSVTPKAWRNAWFPATHGYVLTPVFDRLQLNAGWSAAGPVLIEERESTTVVAPGARATIDGQLNLLIRFD